MGGSAVGLAAGNDQQAAALIFASGWIQARPGPGQLSSASSVAEP